MSIAIHSTIIAASLAATVAVAVASAVERHAAVVAPKSDRLVTATPNVCPGGFHTTETRSNHLSVLASVPVAPPDCRR